MAYPICIFDWDGTLVDSESHIVASLEFASNSLRLPDLGYDAYKDIIGLGMREALLQLYPDLSDDDVERMRRAYADYFFRSEINERNLFGGVIDTLVKLKDKNVRLAVATGKSRNGLDLALKSTGLQSYFEIERCADETKSKPHPLMLEEICGFFSVPAEQCVMVGDTEYDLQMAADIGMDSVGVSYGVHAVDRLRKHKPTKIIDHFPELLSLV